MVRGRSPAGSRASACRVNTRSAYRCPVSAPSTRCSRPGSRAASQDAVRWAAPVDRPANTACSRNRPTAPAIAWRKSSQWTVSYSSWRTFPNGIELPMPAMIASGSSNRSLPNVTLPNGWMPTSRTDRPDSRSARASPPVEAPVPTAPTTVSGPRGSAAVSSSANSR